MFCKNPYVKDGVPHACRSCMPCRIRDKRVWVHRMILESYMHADNSFLTLTYNDDHLPKNGSLDPEHFRLWIMRFRSALVRYSDRLEIPRIRVRYFGVGEYGDQSERPHYHAALFGIGPAFESMVAETWGKGHVMLSEFNDATANYVGGYITKKMTGFDDARLFGRHPEFRRISTKPALGLGAALAVAEKILEIDPQAGMEAIPPFIQHGGKKLPLGRYLRSKIGDALGVTEEQRKKNLSEYRKSLLVMLKDSLNDETLTKEETASIKNLFIRKNAGKVASVEARHNIFKQRKTL